MEPFMPVETAQSALAPSGLPTPALIARAGDRATRRFWEFFAAQIRNRNTRRAYALAAREFFAWCEAYGKGSLEQIEPLTVAAYIEQMTQCRSAPTVKQHLAAIRRLCDWLVTGQILPFNPAASVRGPAYIVKRGKTPVLEPGEARALLDSIDASRVTGRRDRAIIGVMLYSFARAGAVAGMKVEDYYYASGKRWWFRLHEKGGKFHEVPAHHQAEAYMDAYLEAAGIGDDRKGPLFRAVQGKTGRLTARPMTRRDMHRMVKRRAAAAGLSDRITCHSFRATGITAYLSNGGTLEHAQAIAAHESPRTTKLYDRTSDAIRLEEIERIRI